MQNEEERKKHHMSDIIHGNQTGFISGYNSLEKTKRTLTLVHLVLFLKRGVSFAYFKGVFNFMLGQT